MASERKAHRAVIAGPDGRVDVYPLKEWLRLHPEDCPPGLTPDRTSHSLRRGLEKRGWALQIRSRDVLLAKPRPDGSYPTVPLNETALRLQDLFRGIQLAGVEGDDPDRHDDGSRGPGRHLDSGDGVLRGLLSEIEICRKNNAYRAVVILCAAVLERIFLLACRQRGIEIQRQDGQPPTLGVYIRLLRPHLKDRAKRAAEDLNQLRNLVMHANEPEHEMVELHDAELAHVHLQRFLGDPFKSDSSAAS